MHYTTKLTDLSIECHKFVCVLVVFLTELALTIVCSPPVGSNISSC